MYIFFHVCFNLLKYGRDWLGSMQDVNDAHEVALMKAYLLHAIEDKNLEDVYGALSLLHRYAYLAPSVWLGYLLVSQCMQVCSAKR